MGEKGAKQRQMAAQAAHGLVDDLASLGDVTSKGMFGGFGIFESGVMFALVDSAGTAFLRLGPENEIRFDGRHGRMPYGRVPDDVLADDEQLRIWAGEALRVAHSAKNK